MLYKKEKRLYTIIPAQYIKYTWVEAMRYNYALFHKGYRDGVRLTWEVYCKGVRDGVVSFSYKKGVKDYD